VDSLQQPSSNLNAILRAISIACSDAWSYAPLEESIIRHCSRRWAEMFGLDENAINSGAGLSIHDPLIAEGCVRLGLPANWLVHELRHARDSSRALPETQTESGKTYRTTTTVVFDDGGRPIGRLWIVHCEAAIPIPRAVWHRAVEARQELSLLTPRESDILSLVSAGLTNKVTAQQAGISEKTVEKHRASIMRKLGVRSVAELIRRVTEADLLTEA